MTFYLLLGWSGIMLLPAMIKEQIYFAYYILGGGIIYTLGIIPFMIKGKCAHFIWHFFVLLGAVIQWVGIFLYAI
jgi:hemolysin III